MNSPPSTLRSSDLRDLRILFWSYVVMAVLTFVFGAWLYFQLDVLFGEAERRAIDWKLVDPQDLMMLREDPQYDPFTTLLWMMKVMVIVMTPVHALVYVIAAWYLHLRRGYWTLIVIAVFNLLALPVGTIVSILHFIVFARPAVREAFQRKKKVGG